MAISTLPQPAAQAGQATTETPGPGRSPLRLRFNALPSAVRQKILDDERDTNCHFDWWTTVYDDFAEQLEDNFGIRVERMYFSGFWSQGDGACFEGNVYEWSKFLDSLGYKDALLTSHAEDYWSFRVSHSGHYYHENCTTFHAVLELPTGPDDEDFASDYFPVEADPVKAAVQLAVLSKYNEQSLEEEFTKSFRKHMRALYRRLEEEHDYLTSDEAVLDSLEANDRLEELINDAMEGLYA